MVGDWIQQHELKRFLELLAVFVDHDFDETDWQAIRAEMEGHPSGQTRRATYTFAGSEVVDVEIQHEDGDPVTSYRISGGSPILEARVEGLTAALQGE